MSRAPGPLVIGFEDAAAGRDAVAPGARMAQALDARPLVARAFALPEGLKRHGRANRGAGRPRVGELAGPLGQLVELEPLGEAAVGSSAARALNDLAERHAAAAVVVGSSARGPLARLVPGSTAERLLSGAPCAVAVAARGYAAEGTRPLRPLTAPARPPSRCGPES